MAVAPHWLSETQRPTMKKRLDKISEAEGQRSVGSIIKQAIQEFIERWEAGRREKK
jgi:predicted transcriptional regulator